MPLRERLQIGVGGLAAGIVVAAVIGELTDDAAGVNAFVRPGTDRGFAVGVGIGDKDAVDSTLGNSLSDKDFPIFVTIKDLSAGVSIGFPKTVDEAGVEVITADESPST